MFFSVNGFGICNIGNCLTVYTFLLLLFAIKLLYWCGFGGNFNLLTLRGLYDNLLLYANGEIWPIEKFLECVGVENIRFLYTGNLLTDLLWWILRFY